MGFITPGRNLHSRTPGKRNQRRRQPATKPNPTPRPAKPATPPLSRFESLPPEILYRIFTHTGYAPALPAASLHLTHTLNGARHLQLHCLRLSSSSSAAAGLSSVFRRRFFTLPLLARYEARYARVCAEGAALPLRLVSPAALVGAEDLALFAALVERGAGAGVGAAAEELQWALLEALRAGREDVAGALLAVEGVRADEECLRVCVERWGGAGLQLAERLVGRGAGMGGVAVWRAALALGEAGRAVVGWLLEGAAPPGEVLGELSLR